MQKCSDMKSSKVPLRSFIQLILCLLRQIKCHGMLIWRLSGIRLDPWCLLLGESMQLLSCSWTFSKPITQAVNVMWLITLELLENYFLAMLISQLYVCLLHFSLSICFILFYLCFCLFARSATLTCTRMHLLWNSFLESSAFCIAWKRFELQNNSTLDSAWMFYSAALKQGFVCLLHSSDWSFATRLDLRMDTSLLFRLFTPFPSVLLAGPM